MDSDLTTAERDIDLDIEAEVNDALLSLDFIRQTRAEVTAHAANGHVTLDGWVQSPMAVVEAGRAAEAVPGVTGVTNRIVDDASLSRRIAAVLSTDPATRDIPPGYEVRVVFGYVLIVGRFTGDQSRAIVAAAKMIPSVRDVTIKTY